MNKIHQVDTWLGRRMKNMEETELTSIFDEITEFRKTGLLKGEQLRNLAKELSDNVTHTHYRQNMRLIEDEVLFEISRRHHNSILTTNVAQNIISDVITERERQDEKWGIQNHDLFRWSSIIGEEYGEMCKAINEYGFNSIPETKKEIYIETIQTMASCMAMLECMARNIKPKL